MKKIIVFAVLVLLMAIAIFFFCKESAKEETYEPVGFGNEYIKEAIESYLLTQEHFSWKTEEYGVNFCSVENLGSKDDLFPLYVWAYCGEYVFENGEAVVASGFSGPVKINYPNELSFYDPERFSYEVPGDGAAYSEGIKEIFPEDIQQKILEYNSKNILISETNRQKAKSFFDSLKEQ
jgi:uncharacterized protein YxeA